MAKKQVLQKNILEGKGQSRSFFKSIERQHTIKKLKKGEQNSPESPFSRNFFRPEKFARLAKRRLFYARFLLKS
jgi:hypothetical protein